MITDKGYWNIKEKEREQVKEQERSFKGEGRERSHKGDKTEYKRGERERER